MALKDIRVTFFYADEQIFDLVKKWRTRLRLIKWADEFYKRFGFKIDEYPFPYNEKAYRKDFSFAKSKGIRPDYTERLKIMHLRDALVLQHETLKKKYEEFENSPPADVAERIKQKEALDKELHEIVDKSFEIQALLNNQGEFETQFRVLLQLKMQNPKIGGTKPRIPVIFCEFINNWELFDSDPVTGETLKSEGRLVHLLVWGMATIAGLDLYTGPLILIDVKRMIKSMEYALAHELVHGAGNTTADNKGTRGNIMIYADAEGKSPGDVNLEPSDKAKMEVAFFVR
ncbi:MAG TPA: hypothetical protein VHK91_17140 [Flavisolibacter sp.]|jgi:hypothetical protein|nr:hypothetical protein [Flavisolibacter sp.]